MSNLEDQLERQLDALKKDWSWAAILAFTGNLPDLFAEMREMRERVQKLQERLDRKQAAQETASRHDYWTEYFGKETAIEVEQHREQTR
jgi:hypothetical protein